MARQSLIFCAVDGGATARGGQDPSCGGSAVAPPMAGSASDRSAGASTAAGAPGNRRVPPRGGKLSRNPLKTPNRAGKGRPPVAARGPAARHPAKAGIEGAGKRPAHA